MQRRVPSRGGLWLLFIVAAAASVADRSTPPADSFSMLPTGKRVTPLATPGARTQQLNPGLKQLPNFVAGQAMTAVVSPDKRTLLVLTSGYNRNNDATGKAIPEASDEYVFVYDISSPEAKKLQVLKIPDTFAGLAFSPTGQDFFVSGGKDDNVHTFTLSSTGIWRESGEPIWLGHHSGLGLIPGKEPLAAGGVAVTPDGKTAVVANVYNDSVSIVDLASRRVRTELDLRPGNEDRRNTAIPGGEYPFWIAAKSNEEVYVSSVRDREVDEVRIAGTPAVIRRIAVAGNPNKMALNRSRSLLFVAQDNSDFVSVIDTAANRVMENINTTAPDWLMKPSRLTGSDPNDVVLSPDERTLFVSNGGTNCIAVVALGRDGTSSSVSGLIPAGWFPNAVALGGDGKVLYILNSKSVPGPNRERGLGVKSGSNFHPGPSELIKSQNDYILQLEKASLVTVPVPDGTVLRQLTRVVAGNNGFTNAPNARDENMMAELRKRIKHVIYIIKENRTYDQVLGDLGRGNGDPSITEFGQAITPNFHALAREFVDLDNFFDSGEVSGDGWPWSTSGRESDFGQKAVMLNYADRGTNYEYEGTNRDINVGLATLKERKKANPKTPDDPDLLPGASNVAAPDGPHGTPREKGYLWDAVLRKGLTFREYGCMSDTQLGAPREPDAFRKRVVLSRPSNPELYEFGDPYFPGFDPGYPDFYREREWEREFDLFVKNGNLPAFEIVQLPVDHMGDFDTAISGVNTPEKQQADNDYATARLIERVAHSRYKDSTLIFIIEDDSQDGPDHVDAHRSTAYVVGPYVKHGAVVSNYYTTVSMVRTIEDILGLDHLNLNTATAAPMTDVFDLKQGAWEFAAKPSSALLKTRLPLSDAARKSASTAAPVVISRTFRYWAEKTAGFDFSGEDRVNAQRFNRIIWQGMMHGPYPAREY
ncbi:MAG: beta-propeller fold lactonase family protein [Acidobacteriaceae bacterium]|nr:beta-propeller fold lactonase family protein [Acidobacteriaceae bacterium]